MRTVFIFLPEQHNHAMAAAELEHSLAFYLQRRDVVHSSRDFWDDEDGFAEYGVRLDMRVLDDDYFLRLLGGIVFITSLAYGSIRIQLDANCVTT
jgi:hypothetical protein